MTTAPGSPPSAAVPPAPSVLRTGSPTTKLARLRPGSVADYNGQGLFSPSRSTNHGGVAEESIDEDAMDEEHHHRHGKMVEERSEQRDARAVGSISRATSLSPIVTMNLSLESSKQQSLPDASSPPLQLPLRSFTASSPGSPTTTPSSLSALFSGLWREPRHHSDGAAPSSSSPSTAAQETRSAPAHLTTTQPLPASSLAKAPTAGTTPTAWGTLWGWGTSKGAPITGTSRGRNGTAARGGTSSRPPMISAPMPLPSSSASSADPSAFNTRIDRNSRLFRAGYANSGDVEDHTGKDFDPAHQQQQQRAEAEMAEEAEKQAEQDEADERFVTATATAARANRRSRSRGAIPFSPDPAMTAGAGRGGSSTDAAEVEAIRRYRQELPAPSSPPSTATTSSSPSLVRSSDEKGSPPSLDAHDEPRTIDNQLDHGDGGGAEFGTSIGANSAGGNGNDAYATLSKLRNRSSASAINVKEFGGAGGGAGSGEVSVGSLGSYDYASSVGGARGTRNSRILRDGKGTFSSASLRSAGMGGGVDGGWDWETAAKEMEHLDGYVRKIVYQAGLDYETRPMVVLAACNLPDPKEVDYDALLERILTTMDLFVENDYTIVYMAGGGRHRPGWNWMWKAYRRLGRKFRKNLKRLYILHPTFFTRTLVQLISTGAHLVSIKFVKKIVQVKSMSDLATMVDIRQIDFPPEVLACNSKVEERVGLGDGKRIETATLSRALEATRVFGVRLEDLMGQRGEKGGVPRCLRECAEFLRDPERIQTEGLFRRSPSSALLRAAQESYDRGSPVNLEKNYPDPHVAAVLIKVFFRMLPHPIFPSSLYPVIKACPRPDGANDDAEAIAYLRHSLLASIHPPCYLTVLSFALELLHHVARHADQSKMDAANLATVFTPNLVHSGNALRDMQLCLVQGMATMSGGPPMAPSPEADPTKPKTTPETTLGTLIKLGIERYYEIFDEIDYEPPTMTFDDSLLDMSMTSHGDTTVPADAASLAAASSPSLRAASYLGGTWKRGHRKVDSGGSRPAESHSIRSARSSELRGPTAFIGGGMSRNASGSLRLTKGRLGSTHFKGIPSALVSPAQPTSSSLSISAKVDAASSQPQSSTSTSAATDFSSPPLTGMSSGVTVSSANALGQFASPINPASTMQQQQAQALLSPSLSKAADAQSTLQTTRRVYPGGVPPRRELSMVEDGEES